jgi:NADP-dependent aldehyde dehydrogenase
VAVFGASNFPLAFSVCGGDTASALAAGNPVVVKAHPAHPGTSELVGSAIAKAIQKSGMPSGMFSMLHGAGHEVGLQLVVHPLTCAVGFTGSLRAGRALMDAAAARPKPIPVFAEMGSINPVFILPGALSEKSETLAAGLVQSITMGVGQFCTNPGLVVGLAGEELNAFVTSAAEGIAGSAPATMLHQGICDAYTAGALSLGNCEDVECVACAAQDAAPEKTQAQAMLFRVDGSTFLASPELQDEVFGPSSLVVACANADEMLSVASVLQGNLTATVHASTDDVTAYTGLFNILEQKVGRLLFNGFPTGVEVAPAMHHGGPYPASSDVRSTSVGTAAIQRFARPICYQSAPDSVLPDELQSNNNRGIWRLVNNELTKADC